MILQIFVLLLVIMQAHSVHCCVDNLHFKLKKETPPKLPRKILTRAVACKLRAVLSTLMTSSFKIKKKIHPLCITSYRRRQ